MNIRKRLTDEEAKYLGKKLVKRESFRNRSQYYISEDEWEDILSKRSKGVVDSCNKLEVNPSTVKHLWKKTKDESIFIKNPLYVSEEEKTYFDLRDSIIEDMEKASPVFKEIKRKKSKESHLLVVDPADVHIGKLSRSFETGSEYNSQIAVKRVKEGVDGILQKSNGFNIDKILFIGGNDILHIDTPRRTTSGGTPQDTDGMWYDNFLMAKNLYIEVLTQLINVADVHFTFNPSNHDYTNGFFLADVIQTYFRDCDNITFDCSISHRKYFRYFDNHIGTTHGDGAKNIDLPLLMAQEDALNWSKTKHRYIYTHHVHHKTSKDYIGVTVESLRSPSESDSWHHRNGYTGNVKAIEGFIHSKEKGQVARLTHIF